MNLLKKSAESQQHIEQGSYSYCWLNEHFNALLHRNSRNDVHLQTVLSRASMLSSKFLSKSSTCHIPLSNQRVMPFIYLKIKKKKKISACLKIRTSFIYFSREFPHRHLQ